MAAGRCCDPCAGVCTNRAPTGVCTNCAPPSRDPALVHSHARIRTTAVACLFVCLHPLNLSIQSAAAIAATPSDYQTRQTSAIMLSEYDSSRATGAPDGYAYAAEGQWATEAENGVRKGGTLKPDDSQRFVDSPAGHALRRERSSAGLRKARSEMIDDDKKAVVRDRVPAKLLTTPYDVSTLPALCRLARPNRCGDDTRSDRRQLHRMESSGDEGDRR